MKTVAILEGWAGGPKLTRLFVKELSKAGFKKAKLNQAEVVIAHSTGCYMLPKQISADLIMLIDPPYWPGESILKRWRNMGKNEVRFLLKQQGILRFTADKLWDFYYVLAKPSFTYSVLKNDSHLDFLDRLSDKKLILVRNLDDEFCSPKIKDVLKDYKDVKYAEIPGFHANYYLEPQPYIDLLLKEL